MCTAVIRHFDTLVSSLSTKLVTSATFSHCAIFLIAESSHGPAFVERVRTLPIVIVESVNMLVANRSGSSK